MSASVDFRVNDLTRQAEDDAPRAGAAPDPIDHTAAKADVTPATEQHLAEAQTDSSDPRAMKALAIIAILGGLLLAGIGL